MAPPSNPMTQQFIFNVVRLEPLPPPPPSPPLPSPGSRHQRGIDLYSPSPSATLVATGSPASVAARLQISGPGHQPKSLSQSGFTGAPLALKMTFPTGARAASECRKAGRLNTSRGAEEDVASSVGRGEDTAGMRAIVSPLSVLIRPNNLKKLY